VKDHFLKLLNSQERPSFLRELYGDYPYYASQKEAPIVATVERPEGQMTEKEKTLNAFKEFAEEKIEKGLSQGLDKVVFPGLEIIPKSTATLPLLSELETQELGSLELKYLKVYEGIDLTNKVVFFDLNLPHETQEIELSKTQVQTFDLLKKIMIATSTLPNLLLINHSVGDAEESETEFSQIILKELVYLIKKNGLPKVILPLGAKATNCLLRKEDKLSRVRGQFIERAVLGETLTFVPLFHPERLLINPNMKSTTWDDLKKVINFIKA
jgi:uracil-DNA glycosylase family 4